MLAILAMSTSSEELFSTASRTVTSLNSCIESENVYAIVYFNKNPDFYNQLSLQSLFT